MIIKQKVMIYRTDIHAHKPSIRRTNNYTLRETEKRNCLDWPRKLRGGKQVMTDPTQTVAL